VRRLWRLPTIRTAVVYAASGVGFAGANLVLARLLPKDEYAVFTLVLALVNFGFALATAGIDGIVLRQALEFGPRLLGRVTAAAAAVALALGVAAELGYRLGPALIAMVVVSTAAGGIMVVAGAQFQREQRFGLSLSLIQSPNLFLALAAAAVVATGADAAWVPVLIATAGFVLGAWLGWWLLLRERGAKPERGYRFSWGEAFAYAGLNASGLLLVQLERLLIPHVLPLAELATYGVLAAVVGSPFRVLQNSVGYSLLPRLTAATSVAEQRRLVAREVWLAALLVVLASAAVWVAVPLVEHWFLAGKYHLGKPLVLAAVVAGLAKVLNAFSKATVTALASARELALINVLGWVAVVVAAVAAAAAARWGLPGVIYGVGAGWLLRALTALVVSARHLRRRGPSTAPAAEALPSADL
jgi:O-antigen/teichoic acid export membrane protein